MFRHKAVVQNRCSLFLLFYLKLPTDADFLGFFALVSYLKEVPVSLKYAYVDVNVDVETCQATEEKSDSKLNFSTKMSRNGKKEIDQYG